MSSINSAHSELSRQNCPPVWLPSPLGASNSKAALVKLPVQSRICFKLATITDRALYTNSPQYLASLSYPLPPTCLRSSDQHYHQPSSTNIGSRSFRCSAPAIWNSIPLDIRSMQTIDAFTRGLKTHYFCFPPAYIVHLLPVHHIQFVLTLMHVNIVLHLHFYIYILLTLTTYSLNLWNETLNLNINNIIVWANVDNLESFHSRLAVESWWGSGVAFLSGALIRFHIA